MKSDWREQQECRDDLIGKPCMFCKYQNEDCMYEYQTCGVAYYDEYEETYVVDVLNGV